jgi:hypothetical protein
MGDPKLDYATLDPKKPKRDSWGCIIIVIAILLFLYAMYLINSFYPGTLH